MDVRDKIKQVEYLLASIKYEINKDSENKDLNSLEVYSTSIHRIRSDALNNIRSLNTLFIKEDFSLSEYIDIEEIMHNVSNSFNQVGDALIKACNYYTKKLMEKPNV